MTANASSHGMVDLSDETRDGRFYHPELDGLRFFAFFAVFIHHAFPHSPDVWLKLGLPSSLAELATGAVIAGGYGVDFFFALSAYLITELLLREHARFGRVDFKRFFIRRSLRIWPLYFFFLAFSFWVVPHIIPQGEVELQQMAAFGLFLANWEIAMNGYPNSVVAPMWSIAIEEQFYVAWPTVVRIFKPERLVWAVSGMFVVALATRGYLVAVEAEHPAIWCNTLARLDPIAAGALLAIALRGRAPIMGQGLRWLIVFGCVVTIAILTAYVPMDMQVPAWNLVWVYLFVGLATTLILFAALKPMGAPKKGLAGPVMVYLGRISYGLYVFHMFGLGVARQLLASVGSPHLKFAGTFLVGLAITVGCSVISYHLLEKPFLKLKTKFAKVQSRPE